MENVVLMAHRVVLGDVVQMYELLFAVQGRPIYVNLYNYAVRDYISIDDDNTGTVYEAAGYAAATARQGSNNN